MRAESAGRSPTRGRPRAVVHASRDEVRALRELARLHRIELALPGGRGARSPRARAVPPELLVGVLRALGAPIAAPGEARSALRAHHAALASRMVEPVVALESGALGAVLLRFPNARVPRIEALVELEDGGTLDVPVRLSSPVVRRRAEDDGAGGVLRRLALPALPVGYHRLVLDRAGSRDETHVLAAPAQAHLPAGPAARAFGVFAPLYALHSVEDFGIGGFGDLDRIGAWLAGLGGTLVATLPLLASFLDEPFDPSPYAPVSRRFWNEVFLDIERLPELELSRTAREILRSPGLRGERVQLAAGELVDYRRTMRAKRRVLTELARALESSDSAERDAYEAARAARPELELYARFRAAREQRGTSWQAWTTRAGEIAVADCDPNAVRYYRYAQWRAGRQLAEVAQRARERGAGLCLDFPVGAHAQGYDAWRDQMVYAFDAHAGAPPDALFAGGQDWGFPPLHPERIRAAGYRPLIAGLRSHCEHAAVLRIDHVIGLHRMYWIPAGASAQEGVFVRYHPDEMYALLCIESARARTAIVGEDLGSVPRELRPMMASRGIQRMYVLQHELVPDAAPPIGSVPRTCMAALNTHDMPPFAAFLSGANAGVEREAEIARMDRRGAEEGPRSRARLVRALLADLRARGWLPARKRDRDDVLRAALAFLAASPARVVIVSLADLCGESRPQNLPGTGVERANWRLRLRLSVEEICSSPALARELGAIAERRARGRRGVGAIDVRARGKRTTETG